MTVNGWQLQLTKSHKSKVCASSQAIWSILKTFYGKMVGRRAPVALNTRRAQIWRQCACNRAIAGKVLGLECVTTRDAFKVSCHYHPLLPCVSLVSTSPPAVLSSSCVQASCLIVLYSPLSLLSQAYCLQTVGTHACGQGSWLFDWAGAGTQTCNKLFTISQVNSSFC